ncbi:hypothetical protein BLX87_02500 [Bacillus sp. VT-16-64]|nr:hypothetical protein BLX87_02500 [Bacillus sp. VT-16-64]
MQESPDLERGHFPLEHLSVLMQFLEKFTKLSDKCFNSITGFQDKTSTNNDHYSVHHTLKRGIT